MECRPRVLMIISYCALYQCKSQCTRPEHCSIISPPRCSSPEVPKNSAVLVHFPNPMSERYAATDDLDLELETRRMRRRSVYYGQQRAGPSQSVQAIPPTPTRSEIVSREEFWKSLDDERSPPPTPSTDQSETPSRLQRMRARLNWQTLKEVFRV